MSPTNFLKKHVYLFFLIAMIIFTNIQASPMFSPEPHRDSGAYLYIGKVIAEGGVPYRDTFEHKGPIMFFINALGALINSRYVWGIWLVEIIFISLAAIFSYKFFAELYGKLIAFLTTSFWLLFFSFFHMVNYTENYYLLFQFILLFLFLKTRNSQQNRIHYYLIGVFAALSFLIRGNMIGVTLTIFILWVWQTIKQKDIKDTFQKFLFTGLGSFTVFVIISLYFIINGSFFEFISQAFLFNFWYVSSSNGTILSALEQAGNILGLFIPLSIGLWLTGIPLLFSKTKLNINRIFLLFAIINFPIEIILSILSGHPYLHYYIPWFLPISLLSGMLFYLMNNWLPDEKIFNSRLKINQLGIILLVMGFSFSPLLEQTVFTRRAASYIVRKGNISYNSFSEETQEMLEFLKPYGKDNRTLLIWGLESGLNYLSDMRTPTRYYNSIVFSNPRYFTQEKQEEYINSILENKPLFIEATTLHHARCFLFGDPCSLSIVNQMQPFFQSHFVKIHTFETNGWTVYEFIE